MRIRTTGSMMVERALESMRIDDQVSPASDAENYECNELVDAVASCIFEDPWLREFWPVETECLTRAVHGREQDRERVLALGAALLIREIDRLEHLRIEKIIHSPATRSSRHAR